MYLTLKVKEYHITYSPTIGNMVYVVDKISQTHTLDEGVRSIEGLSTTVITSRIQLLKYFWSKRL